MKVIVNGREEFSCTKAEKGSTYIQLYNGEEKGILFAGISDFTAYSIEGGEWSDPEISDREEIEQSITDNYLDNVQAQQDITSLQIEIEELKRRN